MENSYYDVTLLKYCLSYSHIGDMNRQNHTTTFTPKLRHSSTSWNISALSELHSRTQPTASSSGGSPWRVIPRDSIEDLLRRKTGEANTNNYGQRVPRHQSKKQGRVIHLTSDVGKEKKPWSATFRRRGKQGGQFLGKPLEKEINHASSNQPDPLLFPLYLHGNCSAFQSNDQVTITIPSDENHDSPREFVLPTGIFLAPNRPCRRLVLRLLSSIRVALGFEPLWYDSATSLKIMGALDRQYEAEDHIRHLHAEIKALENERTALHMTLANARAEISHYKQLYEALRENANNPKQELSISQELLWDKCDGIRRVLGGEDSDVADSRDIAAPEEVNESATTLPPEQQSQLSHNLEEPLTDGISPVNRRQKVRRPRAIRSFSDLFANTSSTVVLPDRNQNEYSFV